jgi:hypothetical protein
MRSPEHARKVAAEYLSGLGQRWDHVRVVGELAEALAYDGLLGDDVVAAAWLHDLGYAEELQLTGLHPLDGARFLVNEGAPVEVVALVAHHTGAAYEAEERGLAAELNLMPTAGSVELDVLTLLDLVTAPDGKIVHPEDRIAEILDRYPEASPVFRAVTRSRLSLLAAAGRARDWLGLSDDWPAGVIQGVREA